MFELNDVAVSYGGTPALAPTSLSIGAGETLVLLGPSGSGKSTLLRSLAGLTPFTGTLRFEGAPVTDWRAVRRRLGYVIQDGGLFPHLTARGNVTLMARELGWEPEPIDARVGELAKLVALEPAQLDRFPAELSGGQRQRVWIAMALAQQTPILLLDEPTTYLDIAHQIDVLELARGLQQDGYTVVVVLHELNLAFRYATHLLVMRDGAIVAAGEPGAIVSAELIEDVYGLPCRIITDPESGTPLVIPRVAGG